MKLLIVAILLVVGIMEQGGAQITSPRPGCPGICPFIFDPVCGMRLEGETWIRREFGNECQMDVENRCGQYHYVPCLDDPSTGTEIPPLNN